MCTLDLLMQRFRANTADEGPQLVSIDCTGLVAMIWVALKTMISAYVRTNIVSQFMALQ